MFIPPARLCQGPLSARRSTCGSESLSRGCRGSPMPPEQSLPLYKHPATCFFAVAPAFLLSLAFPCALPGEGRSCPGAAAGFALISCLRDVSAWLLSPPPLSGCPCAGFRQGARRGPQECGSQSLTTDGAHESCEGTAVLVPSQDGLLVLFFSVTFCQIHGRRSLVSSVEYKLDCESVAHVVPAQHPFSADLSTLDVMLSATRN